MILFVDDEERRTEAYREACELAGLKIDFIDDAETVVDFLRDRKAEIQLLVLDVMMPMGSRYNRPEATFGTRTGLEIFKDVRTLSPTLPVLLFTQSHDREVDLAVEGDDNALVARKQDVLPSDLPALIKQHLERDTK